MKFKENKLIGGGGNSLKPSHNQDFSLIETFNNLALWGEKKFVSELKRTYKFQRGVYCHTEDNSPKYRMVGEILSILRSFAVQTRIFAKECNIIAVGYVRSTAQNDENLNRLRNKCAMTDYGHAELVLVSCGLNPSPAFQAPSAQGRQGHTHRTALRFPLSPQVARGKIRRIGNMKENIFSNMVYSLFTTHHSLRKAAFTLAEVLVTLSIIGVVSAMTVPTLMQNYQRQSYVTQLHKTYNEMSQALLRYQTDRNALNLREAGMSSQAEVNNFISSYFKVVNSCLDSSTVTPCFANQSEYKKISGATASGFDNDADGLGMSFVLANGTSIRPWLSNGRNFIVMVVDVNGQKGPNILGRDFFDMCIDVNGNIDTCLRNGGTFPHTEAQRETEFNDVCIADSASIAGCFGKILNDNWQMNY